MDSFKQFLKEVAIEGLASLAAVAIVIGCMFAFVYSIKIFYK
jgi:hypothetical protein